MIKSLALKFFVLALDFVYPKACVGCKKPDTYLCPLCQRKIEICDSNLADHEIFVFHYHDPRIRKLIWLLKYRNIKEIAELFGKLLYEMTIEELAEEMLFAPATGKIAIIPVPLSRKRLRERGYNQSEEIAKAFVANDPKNFYLKNNLLSKNRETATQVSLTERSRRLSNLKNAFSLRHKTNLKNKTVILLDDVSTTGTTLNECARVLKKTGAKRIIKVAVAHG